MQRKALTAYSLKRAICSGLSLAGISRARALLQIFRFVIVIFAVRDDLAGQSGLGIVVAQYGDFDLASLDEFLEHNLLREIAGEVDGFGPSSLASWALVMPTEEPSVAGLTKIGNLNFFSASARTSCARFFPARNAGGNEISDRQAGLAKQTLLHVLIHAYGRANHAGADKGKAGEIEESLHGAVFAESAVQHREDHVDAEGAGAVFVRWVQGPRRWDRAVSMTQADRCAGLRAASFCAPDPASQRPSLLMPMGTASYFSGSSARITEGGGGQRGLHVRPGSRRR